MNIDWMVAIVTFLILTVFSFNYYTGFFTAQADLGMAAEAVNDRVINSMLTQSYSLPVYYYSPGQQSGKVLYTDFVWPQGTRESTRILLNGVEQPCLISGDRVYWQSNLINGANIFTMTFANVTATLHCQDNVTIQDEDEATPWSMETKESIAQNKLNIMSLLGYEEYRKVISVSRDMRIEVSNGFSLGPQPPQNIDVYAFQMNSTIAETAQDVQIRVLVW
jgi:hypothetical protein